MTANLAVASPQVRVMKKVRRQFLHKTPDIIQIQNPLPVSNQEVNDESIPIQASLGFFEKGKKLYVAAEFVNLHFDIVQTQVDKLLKSKIVTLNLSPKEQNIEIPWEETVKRLESYGDLDCATWAHRIRNYQLNYIKAMANYHEILNSGDPQLQATIRKTQMKAVLACRDIESKYPFQKYVQLLKKDTHQLISCSYSDDFLKELGFTSDTFVLWTQKNGVPKIFDTNNDLYYNAIKAFFNFVPTLTQSIVEGDEIETTLHGTENRSRRIKVRFINVLEPRSDMPIHHCYLIINKENLDVSDTTIRQKKDAPKEADSRTETESKDTDNHIEIKNVTTMP